MGKKCKVLWIEDEATHNLTHLYSPLITSIKHDLTLAVTTSEAMHYLRNEIYDVLIFDLRIDPGNHEGWIRLHERLTSQIDGSVLPVRLGLHLLFNLLGVYKGGSDYYISIPTHVQNKFDLMQMGILSVDNWGEIEKWLGEHEELFVSNGQRAFRERFGVTDHYYIHKQVGMPNLTLKRLVERIQKHLITTPNRATNPQVPSQNT